MGTLEISLYHTEAYGATERANAQSSDISVRIWGEIIDRALARSANRWRRGFFFGRDETPT